jgi:hypothetical protein
MPKFGHDPQSTVSKYQTKLQMNYMWIKIKHGTTANSKKYWYKEIEVGIHTCIV